MIEIKKTAFWTLVLVTLWLSLIPGERVPSPLHFWDKAQHAVGFAGLAVTGLLAYPGQARRVLLGLALLGIGIEVAQWLTGWRQGDWVDWVADCAGLVVGTGGLRLALMGTHRLISRAT